jgi:hypothetical protein
VKGIFEVTTGNKTLHEIRTYEKFTPVNLLLLDMIITNTFPHHDMVSLTCGRGINLAQDESIHILQNIWDLTT